MNRLDSILEGIHGAPDDVDNLAAKIGIDPSLVEMAIRTLSETHQAGGDTVSMAAARTGIDASILRRIIAEIGGEGSLGHFANALAKESGAGAQQSARPAVTDIATGLFGKR